jgi:hypothetical protein
MNDDTSTAHASEPPIDIADVIAQLAGQQARFAAHIDGDWDGLDAGRLARLLTLYGQNATRLGRLLRDRHALYGDAAEEVDKVFARLDARLDGDPESMAEADEAAESSAPPQPAGSPDHPGDSVSLKSPADIDDVILGLAERQTRLARYLDSRWGDPEAERPDTLLAVYSQNATRLGRLLRDRAAIYGPPPDPLQVLIDEALEHFWQQVDAQNAARDSSTPDSPAR